VEGRLVFCVRVCVYVFVCVLRPPCRDSQLHAVSLYKRGHIAYSLSNGGRWWACMAARAVQQLTICVYREQTNCGLSERACANSHAFDRCTRTQMLHCVPTSTAHPKHTLAITYTHKQRRPLIVQTRALINTHTHHACRWARTATTSCRSLSTRWERLTCMLSTKWRGLQSTSCT